MILHNDAVDAILTRRSIRSYQAKQISEDALETILTAGQYAPSGMNQQSAKAIVVQSKERMQQLVQLAKAAEQVDHNPFYDAPFWCLPMRPNSHRSKTAAMYWKI
mgnify:CR=1 FL=1